MIEKRVQITLDKPVIASRLLEIVQEQLAEDLKLGWKIGAVVASKSLTKTVILFI